MMFKIILQLHAHKKGTGSSHNGRDSNAQRLGTKAHDSKVVTAGSQTNGVPNAGSASLSGADANGKIWVKADVTNLNKLTTSTNVLTITPMIDATTALVGTTDGGKNIHGWRCGNSTTDGTTIDAKYLPASCRGTYP